MVREHHLTPANLIWPLFVCAGDGVEEPIASLPGGTDFDAADALGIRAEHALALPGKCAPDTAGALIAQTVLTILQERGDLHDEPA